MPDDKKPVNEPESELAPGQTRGESPVSVEQASRMLLAAQSELERLGIKTASIVEKSKLLEAQQVLEELKTAQFKLDRLGIETNHILDRSGIMNAEKALAKMQAARAFMESSGQIFIDKSAISPPESQGMSQPEQELPKMTQETNPNNSLSKEFSEARAKEWEAAGWVGKQYGETTGFSRSLSEAFKTELASVPRTSAIMRFIRTFRLSRG